MEFLVNISIALPLEMDGERRAFLVEAEAARARELAHDGALRRVWRIPGRLANWSLYETADATALHDALSSLPLWPWMTIEVHPLAKHASDPGASAYFDR